MSGEKSSLLLIHPAVTTTPELVESVKKSNVFADSSKLDQFLVNKLNDSSVQLEDEKYSLVYYLTPEKESEIQFPTKLIAVLAQSLRGGGRLFGLSDVYKIDALINGFEVVNSGEQGYHWVKKGTAHTQTAPVALRPKRNTPSGGSKTLPIFAKPSSALPAFKKAEKPKPTGLPTFKKPESPRASVVAEDLDDGDELDGMNEDDSDSDELAASKSKFFDDVAGQDSADSIDEDDLVDDAEKSAITVVTCGKTKTRRRKACKDCTCGLKEAEAQEADAARAAQDRILGKPVKFDEQELTEIDFTIQGKKVGGCGSCSLGDAFRCSGCPYLGLPAFKPGQPISLDTIADDL